MIVRLAAERFDESYRRLFDSVFYPTWRAWTSAGLPFRHSDWEVVVSWAPYDFEEPALRALRAAAREMGDSQVVITDCEAEPGHRYPTLFDIERDSIYRAYMGGPNGTDAAMFGTSATWGVYFEYEWRLAYVGGVARFMDVFLKEVGGVEALKQELRQVVAVTGAESELRGIRGVVARVGWDREVCDGRRP
jgi:hypothetical protein